MCPADHAGDHSNSRWVMFSFAPANTAKCSSTVITKKHVCVYIYICVEKCKGVILIIEIEVSNSESKTDGLWHMDALDTEHETRLFALGPKTFKGPSSRPHCLHMSARIFTTLFGASILNCKICYDGLFQLCHYVIRLHCLFHVSLRNQSFKFSLLQNVLFIVSDICAWFWKFDKTVYTHCSVQSKMRTLVWVCHNGDTWLTLRYFLCIRNHAFNGWEKKHEETIEIVAAVFSFNDTVYTCVCFIH